jgi:hypothetical protein
MMKVDDNTDCFFFTQVQVFGGDSRGLRTDCRLHQNYDSVCLFVSTAAPTPLRCN